MVNLNKSTRLDVKWDVCLDGVDTTADDFMTIFQGPDNIGGLVMVDAHVKITSTK